jgi:hypothetical protein
MALAGARTEREDRGESRSERFRRLAPTSTSTPPTPVEADLAALATNGDLLGWLRAKGYRLPDEVDVFVDGAGARPDLIFRLDGANLAVFVDVPGHPADSTRDIEAGYRLEDAGWDVVRFPTDADWDAIADSNRGYFHLR